MASACGRTKVDLPVLEEEQIEPRAGLLRLKRLQEAGGDEGGGGRGGGVTATAAAALHHGVPVCVCGGGGKEKRRENCGRRNASRLLHDDRRERVIIIDCGVFPATTTHLPPNHRPEAVHKRRDVVTWWSVCLVKQKEQRGAAGKPSQVGLSYPPAAPPSPSRRRPQQRRLHMVPKMCPPVLTFPCILPYLQDRHA